MKHTNFTKLLFVVLFSLFILGQGQGVFAKQYIPESDLIDRVLRIVNQGYVDKQRIKPKVMLEGALDKLSSSIAQVLTKVDYKNGEVFVQVSVDTSTKTFKYPEPKSIKELNMILQQVVIFTKRHLEKEEKPENVEYAAINGFLQKLDPHSFLLVPEAYSDFSTNTSGKFGGVGMMIGIKDGQLTIISPIDDTPASRANLKANDKIVQIDDESTVNMSLSDAVNRLRGDIDTQVTIFIMRKGFAAPKKFLITRAVIKINSVESHVFEEDAKKKRIGYLKIKTFQKNTYEEILSQLDEMDYDLNDFYGLILDLRNNPGGLLDQAIRVSDLFLDRGVIVATAGVTRSSSKQFKANWFKSIVDIPLVILVNHGSASASEIVSAALKKNNRAVVIGKQTFGKGSVQQVIPLRGGSALKMTTSKYLTPGNLSIQSVGVTPNVIVEPYVVSSDFLKITSSSNNHSEHSLDQDFAEWGDKPENPDKTMYYLYENDEDETSDNDAEMDFKHAKIKRLNEDFLVDLSRKILVENKKRGYKQLLNKTLGFIDKEQKKQEAKLIEKFKSYDTDWSGGTSPKKPRIASKIWLKAKEKGKKEDKGKESWVDLSPKIEADTEIRIYLQAKNVGKSTIPRLIAITKSENPTFEDRQFAFGKLKPGESKTWFVPVTVSKSSVSRNDLIEFSFLDQSQKEIHKDHFEVQIEEPEKPKFTYKLELYDGGKFESEGNQNGVLEMGEKIAVVVSVENEGNGGSGPVTALLKNGEGKNVFLRKGRQNLKEIESKKSKQAVFSFDLKKMPADGQLDFSLDILDGTFPFRSTTHKIQFPIKHKVAGIENSSPDIQLSNRVLTSPKKSYKVSGSILDRRGVKDVFVFKNNQKVYYRNFSDQSGRAKVNLEFTVDLDKENNQIMIVSRDDENVSSQEMFYVRYTGKM